MTLSDRIQLIDDLIRENRDITIGEYWDTINEIESVEHKSNSLYLQTTAGVVETEIIYNQFKKKRAS